MNDEEQAKQAVAVMLPAVNNGDFKTFYRKHCHKHLRDQMSEREFIDFMQSDQGKNLIDLFATIVEAIWQGKGNDTLVGDFNQWEITQYEFVLVKERPGYGTLNFRKRMEPGG